MVRPMSCIITIKSLIDLWPNRKDLADEISVSVDRVHKWAQTDSIPARFHARILRAAEARGFCVSADDLVRLHDRPEQAA